MRLRQNSDGDSKSDGAAESTAFLGTADAAMQPRMAEALAAMQQELSTDFQTLTDHVVGHERQLSERISGQQRLIDLLLQSHSELRSQVCELQWHRSRPWPYNRR